MGVSGTMETANGKIAGVAPNIVPGVSYTKGVGENIAISGPKILPAMIEWLPPSGILKPSIRMAFPPFE